MTKTCLFLVEFLETEIGCCCESGESKSVVLLKLLDLFDLPVPMTSLPDQRLA